MTGESTGGAGGATDAADRLAAEARASAEALLDWLGPRLDGARAGAHRPPQSAGACSWCPVCALVAALRGEQPELTARLAEQAAGLVVLVRLLLEGHGAHHAHPGPAGPVEDPTPPRDAPGGAGDRDGAGGSDGSGGASGSGPRGETRGTPRRAGGDPLAPPRPGDRPTGRRSPRPSPRLHAVPPAPGSAGPAAPAAPAAPRRRPPVQRIAVRRVPRDPC